jgi:hypothetical protein
MDGVAAAMAIAAATGIAADTATVAAAMPDAAMPAARVVMLAAA